MSSVLSRRLVDRRGGHRRRVLDAHRHHLDLETASPEVVSRHQATCLAGLLRHAKDSVPFYRDHLPEPGAMVADTAHEILAGLPVVHRAMIQAEPDLFRARDPRQVTEDATGGSSGTPMTFRVDRATQRAREASLYWADGLAGWRHGDRVAMLWGSPHDLRQARDTLRLRLRWWIENRVWLDSFAMGETQMASFHRRLTRFRPHLLIGYAGSLAAYADFLGEAGIRPTYPRRGVISTAEVLRPDMRERLEHTFGRPVFDRYGNREFGAMAMACPAQAGLHANVADVILEAPAPRSDGRPRSLRVTYLHNRAMPFLRYDTGDHTDWATRTPCVCGRTSPRLLPVSGRANDMIHTPNGTLVHGAVLSRLMCGTRGVTAYQFVQESLTEFHLRVSGTPGVAGRYREAWQQDLRQRLGPGCRIRVEQLDHIPPLPSGKHAYVVSNCHGDGAATPPTRQSSPCATDLPG